MTKKLRVISIFVLVTSLLLTSLVSAQTTNLQPADPAGVSSRQRYMNRPRMVCRYHGCCLPICDESVLTQDMKTRGAWAVPQRQ